MFESMPVDFRLKQAVTAYDRKAKDRVGRVKGAYHNPYALPQYFTAIDGIMEEIHEGMSLRDALTSALSGKLLDVCLVAVGEPRATPAEHRR